MLNTTQICPTKCYHTKLLALVHKHHVHFFGGQNFTSTYQSNNSGTSDTLFMQIISVIHIAALKNPREHLTVGTLTI